MQTVYHKPKENPREKYATLAFFMKNRYNVKKHLKGGDTVLLGKISTLSFSLFALYHRVYASFYILTIQGCRYRKNLRRRFKKYCRRIFKSCNAALRLLVFRPFKLAFCGGFRSVLGFSRLVCFVAAIVLLFNAVYMDTKTTLAYTVTYHGQEIGQVKSRNILVDAIAYAEEKMQFYEMDAYPQIQYAIADKTSLNDAKDIGNAILALHSDALTLANGLFVGQTFYGAVKDRSALDALIESLRTAQDNGTEVKPSAFAQKVKLVEGAYPHETLTTVDAIGDTLRSGHTAPVYYTVKSGDSLIAIARKNGLTLAKLREYNPAYRDSDTLHIGEQLVIKQSSSVLQIKTYRMATYTESIPFETKVYLEKNHYADEQRIAVKGVNGSREVTAEIEYTDGVETARKELKSTVLKEPVTQRLQVGAKQGSRPQGSGVATGKFTWPLPHFTTITSYYGPRWGKVHQGLDISGYNVYGASIVAADGGTVVAVNKTSSWGAGMFAGYGYAVIIDHGNGLRTLYAHCSRILVNAGDKVSKGQVIARVGNTGMSTGPHLHFEVRRNNSRVNPLPYLQ